MASDVLCLRPEADFARVDALPPASLKVSYAKPDDPALPQCMQAAAALVIPAVGPKLAAALFEGCRLGLVQITGAGLDRLDESALTRLGIPVANVPGASNSAVAEYAVTAASMLLRRMAWADSEISQGHYVDFRARMLADSLPGLEGLLVGVVGFGTIGTAVAQASTHGLPHRFLRSGAPRRRCRAGSGRKIDVAAGTVDRRRRGDAACAADRGDARHDR